MNREIGGEELRELAAGYALGSLDGEDRGRFEALLRAGDRDARRELRQFEETLARDGGRAAGGAAARGESRAAGAHRGGAARGRRGRRRPRRARRRAARGERIWTAVLAGAMAAGIAAIAVGLAVSTSYERRLETLGQEAAALKAELERQASVLAILRDPATQMVALSGLAPSPDGARADDVAREGGRDPGGGGAAAGARRQGVSALGHRRAGALRFRPESSRSTRAGREACVCRRCPA